MRVNDVFGILLPRNASFVSRAVTEEDRVAIVFRPLSI